MNTMKLCITCLILTFCFLASPVWAEVPRTISYQGSLKQTDGTPVDGTVSMQFALYDSLSGGSALWSETQSVSVNNGIYSVVLGAASPLDLLFNVPYYLEVTVDGTALTPRQELTSAPYALGVHGLTTKNGKVGINTTDPTANLTVDGDAIITNNLYLPGQISGHLRLSGSIRGGADRYMELCPNNRPWNSRAWIALWGDHTKRAGELALAGTYVDLVYGSTPTGYGTVGMRLTSDGNLGIGRTDPSYKADIAGNMRLTQDTGTNQGIGTMRFKSNVLSLNANGGTAMNYPYIEWRRNGSRGAYLGWGSHGNYFQLNVESNNDLVLTGGNVGIGTFSPQYALDVSGDIRGNNVSPSDRRWKTEIAPLDKTLQQVTQLQGVRFRWKDPAKGDGLQLGLIAQDVETVFPEVVSTDSEGYKSVAYDKLTAPLIEAVKELKAENDELRSRLEALEALVNQKQ